MAVIRVSVSSEVTPKQGRQAPACLMSMWHAGDLSGAVPRRAPMPRVECGETVPCTAALAGILGFWEGTYVLYTTSVLSEILVWRIPTA